MPIRRPMLLLIVAAAVLAACAGAPAAPTPRPAPAPAPAAQATAQVTAPLAQDNLAYAEALRLAAEAGSLAQHKGDATLIGLLSIRSLTLHYSPISDATLSSLTSLAAPPPRVQGPHPGSAGDRLLARWQNAGDRERRQDRPPVGRRHRQAASGLLRPHR
jgi:hypothetical protein